MAPVPYEDEIIISWVELHRDARYLSEVLHQKGPWKGIIAVTRGGLVPAALVARELDIRLVDTICVTSYDSGAGGGAGPVLPAYDFCMKASHSFNVLDARGAISVSQRAGMILAIRKLACAIAEAHIGSADAAEPANA